jgi:hypothetical protein
VLLEDSQIGDELGSSAWGIKFKTQGTGRVENITLRRLRLGRIVSKSYYGEGSGFALQMSGDLMRNITIEDVVATKVVTAGLLSGSAETPLKGLTIRNFTVGSCEGGACKRFGCKYVDVATAVIEGLSPSTLRPECK